MAKISKQAAAKEFSLDSGLYQLPWRQVSNFVGPRVLNTWVEHFARVKSDRSYVPTVKDVQELVRDAAECGYPLEIKGYGKGMHRITYDVFHMIGYDLEEARIAAD